MTKVCGPMTGKMYEIGGCTDEHKTARREFWTEVAQDRIPIGSVVVSIKYQEDCEEAEGNPLVVTIKAPAGRIMHLVPMMDDEGNGPGALHTWEVPGEDDGDELITERLPTLS